MSRIAAPLTRAATRDLAGPNGPIPSFLSDSEANLDPDTVDSFGAEWTRFSEFTAAEIESGGREYFADLLPDEDLRNARVLDLGCGSGRWTRYLAARAAFVEAVDPSAAVLVASANTRDLPNVRVIHAGVSSLPFPPASFDVVVSVGVLHHVPDTAGAVRELAALVRPGGRVYLYLYYALDDRSGGYRLAFGAANLLRAVVSRLPSPLKAASAEAAAVLIYWPLITLARALRRIAPRASLHERVPLHYYVDKPWKIVRNDALDRLGTPLERRFTKAEIVGMLQAAGLDDIRFGETMPKWRVTAQRP